MPDTSIAIEREPAVTVHVDRVLSRADVAQFERSLGRQAVVTAQDALVRVKFDRSGSRRANRFSPKWGAVLSNLLMGEFSSMPDLQITLPESPSDRLQLARSGMYFALARHEGVHQPTNGDGESDAFDRWSRDWVPADFEEPLFRFAGEDPSMQPERLATDLVAFLNPNYSPVDSESNDLGSVIQPWLRDIFSKARIPNLETRRHLMNDARIATTELLNNIRDHSRVGYQGLSNISLFATGSSVADGRIYLSVSDNGVGMPETLADRYPKRGAADLVGDAFNGDLPRRERGRGEGLFSVRSLAQSYGGSLFVATGPTADSRTVILDHDFKADRRMSPRSSALQVRGTVVVVSLPMSRISNI